MRAAVAAILVLFALMLPPARAEAPPLRIGFGMSLTGPLAGNGKAALVSIQIWADEVNAKGGLLGRKVELVYYDDQGNPAVVPGLYTKLLDVDKVDLVISGYGTNVIVPAIPIVMQRGMTFMTLIGLAANERFHYERYFQIAPTGPDPADAFTRAYFDLAVTMKPAPKRVALAGADAEYPALALAGARQQVKRLGLDIVYDRSYPPATTDYSPIVRAIQATNPDIVYLATYPPDTAGMLRAASEIGLKVGIFGGGLVGTQYAALKTQLGPLLNGVVSYELYVPEPTVHFPAIDKFLEKYQRVAASEKIDALGYYLPPYAYAAMQILEQAITKLGSLDQAKLAQYIHATTFTTVVGDVKFGADGEWAEGRPLFVQYRDIRGNTLEQWKEPGHAVIILPPQLKSGELRYPFEAGKM